MLYAVIAVAHGKAAQVVNAVPGMQIADGIITVTKGDVQRRLYAWQYIPSAPVKGVPYEGIDLPVDSVADNKRWDVFVLAADARNIKGGQYRWVARAMRWLRKHQQQGWTLGPWTPKHLEESFPALWSKVAGKLPHFAGAPIDSHWDYRPTQSDIDDDTDPSVSDVYTSDLV